MNTVVRMITAVALMWGVGCVRSDWIDRTLVTVHVTGTWHGWAIASNQAGANSEIWLVLKQEGPRATGSVRASAFYSGIRPVNGPIDGTVAGDVLSFRQTDGSLTGEMRVSEDTMTGQIADAPPGGRFVYTMTLQRVK
jgi:hypothetical protein